MDNVPSPTRVIVYCRVSTDAQAKEDKASLPEQIDSYREYAAGKGWSIVAVIQETFSGMDLDLRPELTKVRAMIGARQANIVLVAHPTGSPATPMIASSCAASSRRSMPVGTLLRGTSRTAPASATRWSL